MRVYEVLYYYYMNKLLSCFVLCCLVYTSAHAQQHLVDSITKELQQEMPDSNRAMSMMRLAIDYEAIDTAKAFKGYLDAIAFAKSKKLDYQLGRIYQNQAYLFRVASNYTKSLKILDTAILLYRQSDHPNAQRWEAGAYMDIANLLMAQNQFNKAVEYYLKCIALMEKLGLGKELVTPYCNIATLFGKMEEYKQQEVYSIKAVTAAKKYGPRYNVHIAYMMLAFSNSVREENETARKFLDSTRAYVDDIQNIDILFSHFGVSAQVFKKLKQYDSAFYFLQQAFEASKKYNYGYGIAESQLQLGAIAIMQKNYPVAEQYLMAGIKDAIAINNHSSLDEGYKYLSDVYAETGRYQLAYEYYVKYKDIHDSAVNMQSKAFATELEKKYETEKKDNQLLLQKAQIQRKNVFNYILIGGVAMVLIVASLSFRNYKQKRKLQEQRISELEAREKLTATEAVIKGEEQERTRLAKDLHDGLGGMLSGIKYSFNSMKGNLILTPENNQAFERSMDMLDSSIKEMRRVAHNMMPEALVKFGLDTALKDFCNDVNQSGALQVTYQSIGLEQAAIDQTTAITIYRIVQELVNNTMKHAAATTAIVQVTKSNGTISVTVEDDGKGFDTTMLQRPSGIGWSNIQSRVEYLNGKLDVQSEPGKGTSVHIELKA